jgi:hypothetical protein
MKIYEKAYYTRDGYYVSEYSKTYDDIKSKHLGSDHPDIVTEIIIKDIGCPAEDVEYQTSLLSCNVVWLFKNPLDAIVPDAIEVWDRIDGDSGSEWVQR